MPNYDGVVRIGTALDNDELIKDLKELEGDIESSCSDAEKTSEKLKSGLTAAAKAGVAAVGAVSTAVGAFAAASIQTGASFDASMSQVAATMGTTTDQIEDLRNFAMEMGANTAFSASQAADALNYMALAGYNSEEAMQAIPNVLNLAAAGGMELATASDMVTDAQSALGLTMEESAELVDKMAMASSKSNTSVAQLGEAILTVGGTAKNLAGGTTELSTALGILADNGVKGSEGGTALRNIILSLTAPTDTAAKAMKELGLEVYDAEGNMRPLNDIFTDLNNVLSDMTQGEQVQVLDTLFNKTDLKSANALLANAGDRYEELSGYISDAAGAAEAMANTQLDNLTGDITLFQSALEGAKIALSDQLTPALRNFVQFGSESISTLSTAFQEGGLSGAMEALGTVLNDGLAMILEIIPQVVEVGGQVLGALVQGVIQNLPLLADGAMEILSTLASGIASSLPELLPTIVDIIFNIAETLIDNLDMVVDAAIEITVALAEGLVEALPNLIEKAPIMIAKLCEAIANNLPKILQAAIEIMVTLAKGIIQSIPKIIAAIPQIISAIVTGFHTYMSKIYDIGKNIVEGLWNGIKGAGNWLKEKIGGFFSGIIDGAKDLLGIHSPSTVFAGIGKYMMQGLANGIDKGARFAIQSTEAAVNAVERAADLVKLPSIALSTTSVPAFATGAVIPPNRHFMAVLGDQTSGNNIEAPESLLRKIVREETGGGNTELLQAILEAIQAGQVIKVNETVLGRTSAKAINKLTQSSGKPVLLW